MLLLKQNKPHTPWDKKKDKKVLTDVDKKNEFAICKTRSQHIHRARDRVSDKCDTHMFLRAPTQIVGLLDWMLTPALVIDGPNTIRDILLVFFWQNTV